MHLSVVFVVLLPILIVHAVVFEGPGSERPGLLFMIAYPHESERKYHSLAGGFRTKTNKGTLLQTKNIFGHDDRIPVTNTSYPWRAIGKLDTGCTGTLVGPDLVLTAAHCILDRDTRSLYTYAIYFYANMIDGKSNHQAWVSYAWWGTNDPDTYRESDWALLRLDKKLGDTQGWLGTKTVSITDMKATVGTLVGYSGDFRDGLTAGAHVSCRITEQRSQGFFLHNCDNTRGASGGPMFAYWNSKPYIYAVNVAEFRNGSDKSLNLPGYTDDNANIAIWSKELEDKITQLNSS